MTEEEAQKELEAIFAWESAEGQKVIDQLKAEGKPIGLDGHSELFQPISEERNRRIRELQKKCGIENAVW